MTEDTPATSTDPELPSEGDDNQLPKEDMLVERGVDDLLDEGYAPPERDRTNHWGETEWEERHGETLDQRLAEEEPDVWEKRPTPPGDREELRAGRLGEDDDAGDARGTDGFAIDEGVSGGAATAEEAAVHLVEEEYVGDDGRDEA